MYQNYFLNIPKLCFAFPKIKLVLAARGAGDDRTLRRGMPVALAAAPGIPVAGEPATAIEFKRFPGSKGCPRGGGRGFEGSEGGGSSASRTKVQSLQAEVLAYGLAGRSSHFLFTPHFPKFPFFLLHPPLQAEGRSLPLAGRRALAAGLGAGRARCSARAVERQLPRRSVAV